MLDNSVKRFKSVIKKRITEFLILIFFIKLFRYLEFETIKDSGLYAVLPKLMSSNNFLNPSGFSVNSSGIQNPSFFLRKIEKIQDDFGF